MAADIPGRWRASRRLHYGHGLIEKVFAGLQRALGMPPRINLKRQGAADHAIRSQQIRHVPLRSPVRQIDEYASAAKFW